MGEGRRGPAAMANAYGNLGCVASDRGDFTAARDLWTKSRVLYEQIGMPHLVERVED